LAKRQKCFPVCGLIVDLGFEFEVLLRLAWLRGFSSAGRAPALQAGGHRFDPDKLHHSWWFGRPFLIAFAIRGAKLVPAFAENVILWRNTQIAHGFGPVPVLIHRKEKILSGGFQV
jgi:hypothetical protein